MSEGNSVKFRMRNEENNNTTHDNRVDHSIAKATLWKIDKSKHTLALLSFTFSLGIVYLLTVAFPSLQILMTFAPSTIDEAEYLVITDNNGQMHILIIIKEDYIENNPTLDAIELKNTLYYKTRNSNSNGSVSNTRIKDNVNINDDDLDDKGIGKDKDKDKENSNKSIKDDSQMRIDLNEKIVIYMLNKFRYDYHDEQFVPIDMDLSTYMLSELHEMKYGITSKAIYDYLHAFYPSNEISIKNHEAFNMICRTCLSFFNIYSLYCIGIWAWDGYWEFSIIIAAANIILVLASICLWSSNLKNVLSFKTNTSLTIKRSFKTMEQDKDTSTSSNSIVPGDIIVLRQKTFDQKAKKEIIVPCDGLLLEGYCTVDESDLTGENTLVLKKELLNNDERFIYKKAVHSFLYQGTRISSLFSRRMNTNSECNQILFLATNTGYNTYRGDMIVYWQFQKPDQERMNGDQKAFVVLTVILWLICIGPLVYLYLDEPIDQIALRLLNSLTVILPPVLSISISISTFYFNDILRRKDISCVIEQKMNSAGLIKRIVLDKTGTLTESQLDIFCFQTTHYNTKGELSLDIQEFSPSTLNKTYKAFWKKVYKDFKTLDNSYQESYMNNIIYFVECLASCHEVYKIRNEVIGNSIDQKIFIQMNWEMIQEDIHDIKSQIHIEPHNAYKITENVSCEGETDGEGANYNLGGIDIDTHTFHISHKDNDKEGGSHPRSTRSIPKPNFYLEYVKRYEFSSLCQSMSVVVKNSIDNTMRLYMKGAPEKIQCSCASDSLPIDLNEKLRNYTKEGYRVFACATRILPSDWDKNEPVETYQKDMTFLGLIAFDNPIKKDTKDYIQHIMNSIGKISIATGDNVFTTISVAQQCNIIKKNANVFIFESWEENNFKGITVTPTATFDKDKDSRDNDKAKESEAQQGTNDSIEDSIKDNDPKFNSIIKFIDNDIDSILCISGTALNYIIKNRYINDSMQLLIPLIRSKGIIFFRMIPADKSQLVSFFQEDKSGLVVMCGDGANDCKALMTADVGVAINQSNNTNLICHFSSKKDSIECLELILKNSRAFFENNILIFKFILTSSVIKETSVILLNIANRQFSNMQLLYIDALCVLVPIILASQTQAASKLSSYPQQKLSNMSCIISFIGQSLIQIGGQVGYFYFISGQVGQVGDYNTEKGTLVLTSYLFMFAVFQMLYVLFVFNFFSLQRKRFYTNKIYLIYYAVIVYLSICSLVIKDFFNVFGILTTFEEDSGESELSLETNHVITIFWVLGFALVSFSLEALLYYVLSRKPEINEEKVLRKSLEVKEVKVEQTVDIDE